MARYYFHVRRGRVTILDHRGVEFMGHKEAAKEAVRRAVQIEKREAAEVLQSNGAIYPELAASQHASSDVDGSGCATANGNLVDDEFSTVLEVPLASSGRNWFPSA
jgi:hypothetical protein